MKLEIVLNLFKHKQSATRSRKTTGINKETSQWTGKHPIYCLNLNLLTWKGTIGAQGPELDPALMRPFPVNLSKRAEFAFRSKLFGSEPDSRHAKIAPDFTPVDNDSKHFSHWALLTCCVLNRQIQIELVRYSDRALEQLLGKHHEAIFYKKSKIEDLEQKSQFEILRILFSAVCTNVSPAKQKFKASRIRVHK